MSAPFFRQHRSAFFLATILCLILLSAFMPPNRVLQMMIGLAMTAALWAGGSLLSVRRRWHILFGLTAGCAFLLQVGAFGTIYLAVIIGAMVSSLKSVNRSPHHD
jgi:hypothetical protein